MSGSAVVVDGADLARRAEALADAHDLFARLLERNGPPPLWRRQPSFGTLVRLILEQQVSLASAAAAYGRLEDRIGAVEPDRFLASSAAELRADGFSRQKAGYARDLASAIVDGTFDPTDLEPGAGAEAALLSLRGVGPWTAACFRLFALGEPDIWPTGDRALYVSLGRNLGRDDVPHRDEADELAAQWRPLRGVAARMLWHDYLGGRAYVQDPSAGFD